MTWGIQRASGMTVQLEDSPGEVTDGTYVPVRFDASGLPIAPSLSGKPDPVFGSDGEAFLAPGDTVLLVIRVGPFSVKAPTRVVYVVDDPRRKGFAYGTLPGHPEDGEEAFIIERRSDDSVWIIIRAFSRPSSRSWRMLGPVLRVVQWVYIRRYLRCLSGPML